MKDYCLNFMRMVNKSCLVQQMIEKITLEVDAKIYFLTKIAIFSEVKILYSIFPEMNVMNAVLII